jgi:[protein-PII] uridylyltransferase
LDSGNRAARRIVASKSFDNSILCTNESVLIVEERAAEALATALRREGAYILEGEEIDRVREVVFQGTAFNTAWVGKSAREIAEAARSIAWITDETWARLARLGLDPDRRPSKQVRPVATDVELRDGEIHLAEHGDPSVDPTLSLRVATASARYSAPIDRATLVRLDRLTPRFPEPWPPGARDDLVALLLEGERALAGFDALDQMNLLVRILPEWGPVRSRPQRNAYHRYTVDRHLWQASANAAALVGRVQRPDLLVLGALLHDIGKGYPGDHTVVGMDLVGRIGPRMGLPPEDVAVLVSLVEHHLLLPDVATRRDISDDVTISRVAEAVGSELVLDLLHALTEADSLATGPAAWGDWKAGLVRELVERVRHVLGGGDLRDMSWRLFPTAEVLERMGRGEVDVEVSSDRIVVVSPDVPGTFSRVAGVLSLHGLPVLGAEAHSDEQGMAASEFIVAAPTQGTVDELALVADLRRVLANELALEARMAERARTYRRRRATAAHQVRSRVLFDDASSTATVVEVRAADVPGVLYRVTKALAELGLDIRHARVQTLGDEVIDAFYVRTAAGTKLLDEFHRAEVERAVLYAVHSPA